MAKTTIKLPLKKETKNMLQYQAPDDEKGDVSIPTVYIRKDVFSSDEAWPAFLNITAEGVNK
jgi:hypothetical protein